MAICVSALSQHGWAADVTVQPPSGSGFAVRDAVNTADRFRVNESGTVLIPGLNGQPQQGAVTCFSSVSGQLGPCSSGVGTGPTGATGAAGATGATGATGSPGSAGAAGATGATGAQGAQGAQGVQGVQGNPGAIGPTGATGGTGATGAGMLSGVGGPTAGVGNNGDFYLDTAATVVYGPKASGAWPAPGVSLIGPTGATGTLGATGATGATGSTGSAGAAGATGAPGAPGAPGATGAQGIQGVPGSITGSVTIVTGTESTGENCTAVACCATGAKVVGGGFESNTASTEADAMFVSGSFPLTAGGSCGLSREGWGIRTLNSYKSVTTSTCRAYAICVQ